MNGASGAKERLEEGVANMAEKSTPQNQTPNPAPDPTSIPKDPANRPDHPGDGELSDDELGRTSGAAIDAYLQFTQPGFKK